MSKGIIIPIDTCAVLGMQVATEKAIAKILRGLLKSEDADWVVIKSIRLFADELDEGKVNYD